MAGGKRAKDRTQQVGDQRSESTAGLTVKPEIEMLRDLLRTMLREIGADHPEELNTVLAEATGVSRLVSAIVTAVRLENELHPVDDGGVARGLEAIVARAIAGMGKGGGDGSAKP